MRSVFYFSKFKRYAAVPKYFVKQFPLRFMKKIHMITFYKLNFNCQYQNQNQKIFLFH